MDVGDNGVGVHNIVLNLGNDAVRIHNALTNVGNDSVGICDVVMDVGNNGVRARDIFVEVGNDGLGVRDAATNVGNSHKCGYRKFSLGAGGQRCPHRSGGTHVENMKDPDKIRPPAGDRVFIILRVEKS